jgi:cellulose biosynthesis protein BcsQ
VASIPSDLLEKILQCASQLTTSEAIALLITATPLAYGGWRLAWGQGHSAGRKFEIDHGQVPDLKSELEKARFDMLDMKQLISSRAAEVRVLQEASETAKSDQIDLPADIQDVLRIKQALVKDDAELWRLRAARPLDHLAERLKASGMSIVTIGNLKGGVGKTTITANLAAYFAQKMRATGKRVLVVDLDYQGSLTATLLQAAEKRLDRSAAEYILSGQATGDWLSKVIRDIDVAVPGLDLVPASYTLAAAEDQLMMRWLYHTTEKDVRFNLAEFLLSDQVRKAYQVILLDVGPRLTTASISALCASTHLLVPTNLDRMSAETIGSFLSRVRSLKDSLGLPIELAGVVGTMTYKNTGLTPAEEDAVGTIRDGLREWGMDGYIFNCSIPRKQIFANLAGEDVGYRRNQQVRTLFNNLGDELSMRIKL